MRFYTIKISKKGFTLALFFLIMTTWIFLKSNAPLTVETFSKSKPIYEGDKNKKVIAFTCNVAWGNEFIPPLLEVFEERKVKATFFVEGGWAERFPELLKLIYSKGHEIGNHGYSHAHHAQISYEDNLNEIKQAEEAIFKITNNKTNLFAPPYGEFSDLTIKAAKSLDYKTIMWTIDTVDWKKPGIDYIVNKVLDNAGNGKIVLMHPTEDTVKSMSVIIDNLQQQGYKITTVGEMLAPNN